MGLFSDQCQKCGTRLRAEDVFCPNCGAEQAQPAIPNVEQGTPNVEVNESSGVNSSSTNNHQPSTASPSEPITEIETVDNDSATQSPASCIPNPAPEPVSSSSFPTASSECSDLIVEYDSSRVFLEEMTMPFRFKLIPQVGDLSGLSVEVCTQCGIRSKKRVMRTLREGVARELSLDLRIPAGRSGLLTFDVSVRYRRGGKKHIFEASRRHEVYPQAKGGKLFENLKIEIQQGHAGDMNNDFGSLEALAKEQDWAEVFSRISFEPHWETLALEECLGDEAGCCSPPDHPPKEACVEALTLDAGDRRIHLLSAETVRLGRLRDNEIVARVYRPDGQMNRDASRCISGHHCEFSVRNGQCRLVDGFDGRGSTNGTFLDGVRMEPGQPQQLQPLRCLQLSMGTGKACFEVEVIPLERGRGGQSISFSKLEAAGLILRRLDRPEVYVVVWKAVRLGCVDSALRDVCICRAENAFGIRTPDGCTWLTPGTEHKTPKMALTVESAET